MPATGGAIKFSEPNDGHAYTKTEIPCGICILCQQEKARQWGVRLTHEAKLWEESAFLTLTYENEKLPEFGSLQYDHLQKFWKRLRKRIGKLSYYAVGEYGDTTLRPHYHAVLFGHAFTEKRRLVRTNPSLLWTNPLLEEIWGHGMVSVGALTFETAQYTASYVLKKLATGQQYVRIDEETGELIPLEQPRAFMSRNLAKRWWNLYGAHTTAHDLVVINGRKQKPPKAYDRWLATPRADFIGSPGGVTWRADQETGKRKLEEIKKRRKASAPAENKSKRHARARNAHARAKNKSKKV